MFVKILKKMWETFRSNVVDTARAIVTPTHSGWGLRLNVYALLALAGLLILCPAPTPADREVTLPVTLSGHLPQLMALALACVAFIAAALGDAVLTVGIRVSRILNAPEKLELDTIEILECYCENLRKSGVTQAADIVSMIAEQLRRADKAYISSSDDYVLHPLEEVLEIVTTTRPSGYTRVIFKRRAGVTRADVDKCNIFRNV